jgi:hypothetical protein
LDFMVGLVALGRGVEGVAAGVAFDVFEEAAELEDWLLNSCQG